jgi:hypothetical protein
MNGAISKTHIKNYLGLISVSGLQLKLYSVLVYVRLISSVYNAGAGGSVSQVRI